MDAVSVAGNWLFASAFCLKVNSFLVDFGTSRLQSPFGENSLMTVGPQCWHIGRID